MESAADAIAARFTPAAPCSGAAGAEKPATACPAMPPLAKLQDPAVRAKYARQLIDCSLARLTPKERSKVERQAASRGVTLFELCTALIRHDVTGEPLPESLTINKPGRSNGKNPPVDSAAAGMPVWLAAFMVAWKAFCDVTPWNREKALDTFSEELPQPIRTLLESLNPADCVQEPLTLHPEFRARLDKSAAGVGVGTTDIMREGISRVVQEFEAAGSIRFGLTNLATATPRRSPATGTRKPDAVLRWNEIDLSDMPDDKFEELKARARKHRQTPGQYLLGLALAHPEMPPVSALTIKLRHERLIRKAATMLEIKPQTFLDWHLADYVRDLFEGGGLLGSYAVDGHIEYDPETAARVRDRFLKWERRKLGSNLLHKGDPGYDTAFTTEDVPADLTLTAGRAAQ